MGNNIQIFGRTFSDVSSITVNNTSSSAVKYVQEPIFEDITISQDYLAKQNTIVSNGIIFQTDETYPGTPVVLNNTTYANIPNGDLDTNGTGIKIELNRTYHCAGELRIEWSTGEQEIYNIDSDFTPTSYNYSASLRNFSWEGIGISTQTFGYMNLSLWSSSANGYKFFMRPTTSGNRQITKSGVLLEGSYYQISVTSNGFNTINLNLSDNPRFQTIYKSLAYRSVIDSSAPGVSEWCNSLSNITFQQFAGQRFSGNFVFNNVSSIDYYAFGSVYANIGTGATYYWNCSFPNCTTIKSGTFNHNTHITGVYFPQCSYIQDYTFSYCMGLTTVSFPNCTSIGNNAFYHCDRLSSIDFSNCTTIGIQAFWYCSELTTASFPNCTYIDNNAFQYCSKLTTASFPNCAYIGGSAFYSCSALTVASFPSCTSIGAQAFCSCTALTTISFPNCTFIGFSAFYSCSALTTISFPNCTSISGYAFRDCINLSSFYFMGSSIPYILATTFSNTPLSNSTYLGYYGSIYVPSSLLASYKTATNWAAYSSRMVGI